MSSSQKSQWSTKLKWRVFGSRQKVMIDIAARTGDGDRSQSQGGDRKCSVIKDRSSSGPDINTPFTRNVNVKPVEQPVVQPSLYNRQPVEQPAASCKQTSN